MTFKFIHYAHNKPNVRGLWFNELSKEVYISQDNPESIQERNIFTLLCNMNTLLDKPKTWSFTDYGNYKKRNELTLPQKITKEDIRKQSVIYEDVMWQIVNYTITQHSF
jgi:hypothetical protein